MTPEQVLPVAAGRETARSIAADAFVGRVLYERFLIEREMSDPASGGYSSYLAKDLTHFCRKVVVRAVTPTEQGGRSNAFQEICDTLMRLDHPNIEWILETGRLFDGRPYAVTTYTCGQTLTQILQGHRRLVLERAAHIIESLAEALGAAHSRKIIHGDVTPANIVITSREHEAESVRLANFGTAWPADPGRGRFADTNSESLFYTAPELMTDDGRATPASDIYSLAVVAYRMLTGDVPFLETDQEDMLESIVRGERDRHFNLRTDLPDEAKATIMSALQYKAAMRPRDVRVFGIDLANELRGRLTVRKIFSPAQADVPVPFFAEAAGEIAFKTPAAMSQQDEPKKRSLRNADATLSDRTITWSLVVLLLAAALSIPIFKTIFFDEQKTAAVASIVKKPADNRLPRELRYSVEGQSIKNAAVPQPLVQTAFAAGTEYKMTFEADAAGNAYVFSEASDDQGRTIYNVLYPLPKVSGGSAHVEPKQKAKTRPGTFNGSRSAEIVWLVWTAGNQDDLESLRRAALAGDGVVRSENDVEKLKHFLERNKNFKLDLRKDDASQQMVLKGSGDKIVHRIEIEHN